MADAQIFVGNIIKIWKVGQVLVFPKSIFHVNPVEAPNFGKSSPTPWRSHLRVPPPPPCLSTKTHLPHLHHYRFGSWREDRFILIRLTWPHNMQDPHIMHPMYANTGECKPNSETQNRRNTTQKASKLKRLLQPILSNLCVRWIHLSENKNNC